MALGRMHNLMASAGEALGLTEDPFHTAIGEKLLEATDDNLVSENWDAAIAICDIINNSTHGPEQAVRAIKKRLEQCAGKFHKSTLLTLIVLESCVKNCRREFLELVCSHEFAEFLISRVISPNIDPGPEVQTKVLSLLQSWAHAFSHDPKLQGAAEIYMDLKKKGIQFPIPSDEDLLLVQSMQQKPVTPKKSPSSSTSGQDTKLSPTQKSNSTVHQDINQRKPVREKRTAGKRKLSSGQLNKLNRDIQITQRHLEVFSELLSEMIPGQEHPEDVEMLSQVATNSQEMQVRVMELVSQVVDQPDLTMVLLEINDRMNSEMARHQRYLAKCANVTKSHKKDHEAFSPDEILLQVPSSASRPISQVSQDSARSVKSSKETDFQEIEAWMKENEGNEELMREFEQENLSDGATSEEFDSFLRRRAEAVQRRE